MGLSHYLKSVAGQAKREFSMIIFASDLKMFTYFKGTVSVLPGADAGYGGINLTE